MIDIVDKKQQAEAIARVTAEIDEQGQAFVRLDLAMAMLASGEFEQVKSDESIKGFAPLKRASKTKDKKRFENR